ncbi:hypothetical protein [Phytohabitans rumicis]|uniref:Integral membrane protein n=1 Tax=Phytohabitans rumicis TaxID=1076125 RepID=A0A6V8LEY6_9ACTN|nr:hypothetical protein [Phytohabitans rumicis]GFJ94844.1 hypothetical protein Prum_084860 [Phytohabitans rumicis]
MNALRAFGRFWYDFIVGDDWKIAVAVVTALALTGALWAAGLLSVSAVPVAGAVLLFALFALSMVVDVRRSTR